jgi:dTDP-4-dehydrorhamnose 3,5-epimerase
MEIAKTKLEGVLVVKPAIYEDFRGTNVSIYNEQDYAANGIPIKFVEDKISVSSKHVLRGIHRDPGTWKLISCMEGKVYLVVVNCDDQSKDFGQWESFTLTGANQFQVLVPPHYGNAHVVLSDHAVFHYKWSAYYHPEAQRQFRYDDPRFKIWWPIKNLILARRDEGEKINFARA